MEQDGSSASSFDGGAGTGSCKREQYLLGLYQWRRYSNGEILFQSMVLHIVVSICFDRVYVPASMHGQRDLKCFVTIRMRDA